MSAKVEIYGTSNCKKCVNIRDFLDNKKIKYIEYQIDLMPQEKNRMIQRSGLKYYPQVYINNEYIGGEDELMLLEFTRELDQLLNH